MLVAVALAPASIASIAYLSPHGSDLAPCSATKPCATVERALETGAKTVIFRSGRYFIRQGVPLGQESTGTTFRGEGSVILDGGIPLDRLRKLRSDDSPRLPEPSRSHVLAMDLPDLDYGQLQVRGFVGDRPIAASEVFQDEKRLPLAGWPNEGWSRTGATEGPNTFEVEPRAARWGPGGWVHGYWMFDWADAYRPITSIQNGKLTMGGDAGEFGLAKGRRFRALNLPEELDMPGEWWLDAATRRLYVWPTKGSLQLSLLAEPFFTAEGADQIKLENLDFRHGRASAIKIQGGRAHQVRRCRIAGMGTDGMRLEGVSDSVVENCQLTALGEAGIGVSGGDRSTLTAGRNRIQNCRVDHYSQWARTYRPGVQIDGVGNSVVGCTIQDAPHNAILLSGNDHRIAENFITRVCRETGDAGAVYMGRDTTMRGVVVEGNLFRDIGPSVSTEGNYTNVIAVYLDDCWAGTTIRNNVFDIRGQGVMIGGGRDNLVEGNAFINNHPAVSVDQRGTGWAKDFFKDGGSWGFYDRVRAVKADQPPYSNRYPGLMGILQKNAALAEGNQIRNNVSVGGKWLELLDGLTEAAVGAKDNAILSTGNLNDAINRLPALKKVVKHADRQAAAEFHSK